MSRNTWEIQFKDGSVQTVISDTNMSEKDVQAQAIYQKNNKLSIEDELAEVDANYEVNKTLAQKTADKLNPFSGKIKIPFTDTELDTSKFGAEVYGAVEALKTIVTSMPAGMVLPAVEGYFKDKYGEEVVVDPQGNKIYKYRELTDKFMDDFSDTPDSREGQRNVKGFGDFMKAAKIPAIIPGIVTQPKSIGKSKILLKKNQQTATQIKQAAQLLYKEADDAGAVLNQGAFTKFADNLMESFKTGGFRAKIADQNTLLGLVNEIKNLGKSAKGVTLVQLQTLRTMAGDAASNANKTVSTLGLDAMHLIDELTENAGSKSLKSGNPKAYGLWRLARQNWSTQAKLTELNWMMEKSGMRAGLRKNDLDAALNIFRGEVLKMVSNPKRTKMYNPTEVNALKKFAQGGAWNHTLGKLSKMGPDNLTNMAIGGSLPLMAMNKLGFDPITSGSIVLGGMGAGKIAGLADNMLINSQKNKIFELINPTGKFKYGKKINIDPTLSSIGTGLLDDVIDEKNGLNEQIRSLIDSVKPKPIDYNEIPN